MARYHAIVVGAGAAGLTAAALLARNGKRVLVLERSSHLGGRALAVADDGFKLNIGGHLLEDSGSGLTRIMRYLGKELEHGPVSSDMPVWDHERGRWASIRDRYSANKAELRKVIRAVVDTPEEEFDEWDDRSLREWLWQHTDDQGVIDLFEFIALLECLTEDWWDRSASDNLYVREWHYGEQHKAGYSFWPPKGWDGLWQDLADAVGDHGGEVRTATPVSRVVLEDGEVKGVLVPRAPRVLPNEAFEEELIEAPCVISTLPVWDVLRVVPEEALPDWYSGQIRPLAQDRYRVGWLGLYLATEEPVPIIDRMELSTWLRTPQAGVSGWLFEQTAYDPSTAPEGMHLYAIGGVFPGARGRDETYLRRMFDLFEADVKTMYPGFEQAVWRRRHLVYEPAFGVVQKPMLVGRYRPHWRVPNIDGLSFAGETFRSRGIGVDRAARAALTVVEDHLGSRLAGLDATWRY